jgi:hypothetical protein
MGEASFAVGVGYGTLLYLGSLGQSAGAKPAESKPIVPLSSGTTSPRESPRRSRRIGEPTHVYRPNAEPPTGRIPARTFLNYAREDREHALWLHDRLIFADAEQESRWLS